MQSSFITRLDALNAVVTRRVSLFCSLLAVIICLLGFQWLKSQLGGLMLDELQGYDRDDVNTQMLLYGETGRSLRWGLFFLAATLANEIAWRALSDDDWVSFRVLIMVPATGLFMMAQFPNVTDGQIALASATTMGKFWAIRFFLWWLGGLVFWKLFKAARARRN